MVLRVGGWLTAMAEDARARGARIEDFIVEDSVDPCCNSLGRRKRFRFASSAVYTSVLYTCVLWSRQDSRSLV